MKKDNSVNIFKIFTVVFFQIIVACPFTLCYTVQAMYFKECPMV
jgi:hypothetical protein